MKVRPNGWKRDAAPAAPTRIKISHAHINLNDTDTNREPTT